MTMETTIKPQATYKIVQVPTREARIFANQREETLYKGLSFEEANNLQQSLVYFDELISHYAVRPEYKMKSKIFYEYNPHPEPFFIHNGVKFAILGTEKVENAYLHTIKNTVSGNVKTVPHGVLELIVEF